MLHLFGYFGNPGHEGPGDTEVAERKRSPQMAAVEHPIGQAFLQPGSLLGS